MKLLSQAINQHGPTQVLHTGQRGPEQIHQFSRAEMLAIDAAMAAGRPLLVRGEPGTGKTQLAAAVAAKLGRAFFSQTVDAHTQPRDLLWQLDAVARLAEAQVAGQLEKDKIAGRAAVELNKFVRPGALWWGLDWEQAAKLPDAKAPVMLQGPDDQVCDWKNGVVVLVDEIDKAEAEVPNGLLEALGALQFTPTGHDTVKARTDTPLPLVIITSNDEKPLPPAFVRRCLVLHLALPEGSEALKEHLVSRGRVHFQQQLAALPEQERETLLSTAAQQLIRDRNQAKAGPWQPLPGQAEYLDLLRASLQLADMTEHNALYWLEHISDYLLLKAPEAAPAHNEDHMPLLAKEH